MLIAPIADALKFEVRTAHNSLNTSSKYKGPPNDDVDRAWRNLFEREFGYLFSFDDIYTVGDAEICRQQCTDLAEST